VARAFKQPNTTIRQRIRFRCNLREGQASGKQRRVRIRARTLLNVRLLRFLWIIIFSLPTQQLNIAAIRYVVCLPCTRDRYTACPREK